MPKIKPITELKKTSEISEYCHSVDEPVIITKNGYSDMVIMSAETFEREMLRQEIYLKLAESEAEYLSGASTMPHEEFIKAMRAKINGREQN
jgi:PHD/YefM family antitoxin component YafN of YafNO toxin-antitoxin module